MLLLIWADEKYNTQKNACVVFATPKNPSIFHRPQKLPFGQNVRPKKNLRTPPSLKYVSGVPGVETCPVSKIIPNVSLTRIDSLPQSSSGNPPGLKDRTECFIFFYPKCLLISSSLALNGVQMLKCLILNTLYDILSENHNISWTKWYKDLVKLKEKDTVQHCWILLIE